MVFDFESLYCTYDVYVCMRSKDWSVCLHIYMYSFVSWHTLSYVEKLLH